MDARARLHGNHRGDGSGKSIIIGALKLLIGDARGQSLIRSGADACTVGGRFFTWMIPPQSTHCWRNPARSQQDGR